MMSFFSKNPIIKKLISLLIIAIVVYYFTLTLSKNWEGVKQIDFSFNLFSLLSILSFSIAVLSSGYLWAGILRQVTKKPFKTQEAIKTHTVSWLLRYIPGQAGAFLGKLSWGIKKGIPKKAIISSFFYENTLYIFSSLLLVTPILLYQHFDKINSQLSIFTPLLIALPLVLVFYKPFFVAATKKLYYILKKEPLGDDYFIRSKTLLFFLVQYSLPRIINAGAFLFCLMSLFPTKELSLSQILGFGATYILAGIIGNLAFLTPSGLGVREAVIVLFISAQYPIEQAITLSILTRFYTILSDGLLALIVLRKY